MLRVGCCGGRAAVRCCARPTGSVSNWGRTGARPWSAPTAWGRRRWCAGPCRSSPPSTSYARTRPGPARALRSPTRATAGCWAWWTSAGHWRRCTRPPSPGSIRWRNSPRPGCARSIWRALERLRAVAAPVLARLGGRAAAVDADGWTAAVTGMPYASRVALPKSPSPGRRWLPAFGVCSIEPLAGGWLVRSVDEAAEPLPRDATRIVLDLTRSRRWSVTVSGSAGSWSHELSPRHAELLYLLAAAPRWPQRGGTGRGHVRRPGQDGDGARGDVPGATVFGRLTGTPAVSFLRGCRGRDAATDRSTGPVAPFDRARSGEKPDVVAAATMTYRRSSDGVFRIFAQSSSSVVADCRSIPYGSPHLLLGQRLDHQAQLARLGRTNETSRPTPSA